MLCTKAKFTLTGRVRRWDQASRRYEVDFPDEETYIPLKPECLMVRTQHDSDEEEEEEDDDDEYINKEHA